MPSDTMERMKLEVPDFFQEDSDAALLSRAEWLHENLGWDNRFFSKLLRESETVVKQWRDGRAPLDPEAQRTLRHLWTVVLHFLSDYNLESDRVRKLFDTTAPAGANGPSALRLPWAESSIRQFLETRGAEAVGLLDEWVMALRFGDPYSMVAR